MVVGATAVFLAVGWAGFLLAGAAAFCFAGCAGFAAVAGCVAGLVAGVAGVCAMAAQATISSRIKLVLGFIVPSTASPVRWLGPAGPPDFLA